MVVYPVFNANIHVRGNIDRKNMFRLCLQTNFLQLFHASEETLVGGSPNQKGYTPPRQASWENLMCCRTELIPKHFKIWNLELQKRLVMAKKSSLSQRFAKIMTIVPQIPK